MKLRVSQYATRIPQIYGAYIFLGLVLYFFICYLLGVIHVIELRLFNFVIMCVGVYYAMQQYRRTHNDHINYFRALSVGVAATFIATSTFVLFLFILLSLSDNLYQEIIRNAPMGHHLDVYIATSAVWFEGMFSGFMATFILLNFVETDSVNVS